MDPSALPDWAAAHGAVTLNAARSGRKLHLSPSCRPQTRPVQVPTGVALSRLCQRCSATVTDELAFQASRRRRDDRAYLVLLRSPLYRPAATSDGPGHGRAWARDLVATLNAGLDPAEVAERGSGAVFLALDQVAADALRLAGMRAMLLGVAAGDVDREQLRLVAATATTLTPARPGRDRDAGPAALQAATALIAPDLQLQQMADLAW